jgi:methionyl-tRNA formyltransferase
MRAALFYQDGNFVGREYFAALVATNFSPDLVVPVGRMKPESVAIEIERTGGLWNPPPVPDDRITRRFERIDDPEIAKLITEADIDVAIQGGVGILRGALLQAPRIGWINVHPGKLPEYRGNACPEWALLNGDPVVATAHFIDAGIDTGPVIFEEAYAFSTHASYREFRANLYRHCARVLVTALARLAAAGSAARQIGIAQSEERARYWPALGDEERIAVRNRFAVHA